MYVRPKCYEGREAGVACSRRVWMKLLHMRRSCSLWLQRLGAEPSPWQSVKVLEYKVACMVCWLSDTR